MPYRTAPPVMVRVDAAKLTRVLDAIGSVTVGMWPEVDELKQEVADAIARHEQRKSPCVDNVRTQCPTQHEPDCDLVLNPRAHCSCPMGNL